MTDVVLNPGETQPPAPADMICQGILWPLSGGAK
jgi:hypothetical protein